LSQIPAKQSKRKLALIPALIVVGIIGIAVVAGGFAFAASQESHDSFCASCHTNPESSFVERSVAAQPVDLAAYHTTQKTQCIDCHSGEGLVGRVQAELMGARNAFKWYTGTAVQPAVLSVAIRDQNCVKCHQDVTARGYQAKTQITLPGNLELRRGDEDEGGPNHWHENLARWQAKGGTAGCVTCHSGHSTGATAAAGFIDAQAVETQCQACHRVMRRGRD
jgi:hypothetical protein